MNRVASDALRLAVAASFLFFAIGRIKGQEPAPAPANPPAAPDASPGPAGPAAAPPAADPVAAPPAADPNAPAPPPVDPNAGRIDNPVGAFSFVLHQAANACPRLRACRRRPGYRCR